MKKIILLTVFFALIYSYNTIAQTNTNKLTSIKNDYKLKRDSIKKLIGTINQKDYKKGLSKKKNVDFSKADIIEGRIPIFLDTYNREAATVLEADKVHEGGVLGYDLSGVNQNILVWDEGAAFENHVEFNNRLTLGDPNAKLSKHATHVSGSIIASGIDPKSKGLAYRSSLIVYDWNDDIEEMTNEANTASLSNHSYGPLTGWNNQEGDWYWYGDEEVSETEDYRFGFYSSKARLIDAIAHAAPNYLMLFSAGNERNSQTPINEGNHYVLKNNVWPIPSEWIQSTKIRNQDGNSSGYDCISGPAISKNVLTIGAAHGSNSISSFSSFGPTDDGRIKPDIIAPGTQIWSTDISSKIENNITVLDSNNDHFYSEKQGTSMASPLVTGSLALIREYYENQYNRIPLSSTLKGLAIHTAEQINGITGPSYKSGWGMLNVKNAITFLKNDINLGKNILIQERDLKQGEEIIEEISIIEGGKLRVTICWTDPEGPLMSAGLNKRNTVLINDLDIYLENEKGETFYPFIKAVETPELEALTGNNNVDNVEQILIQSPEKGNFKLKITHKGELTNGSQQFSLFISGLINQSIAEPEVPVLLMPAEEVEIVQKTIIFSWENNSSSNKFYDIQLAKEIEFSNIVYEESDIISTTLNYSKVLESNTKYFWRVRSKNSVATSEWSKTGEFLTGNIKSLLLWKKISNNKLNQYINDLIINKYGEVLVSTLFKTELEKMRSINYKSFDNGITWEEISNITYKYFSKTNDGEALGYDPYNLINLGLSFGELKKKEHPNIEGYFIRYVTLSNDKLYLTLTDWGQGDLNDLIFYSIDNGNSWIQLCQVPFKSQSQELNVYGEELLITSWGSGTWRSKNNGKDWEQINDYPYSYSITKSMSGKYYIGTISGLLMSSNDNFEWVKPLNGVIESSKVTTILENDNGLLIANSYGCQGIGDGIFVSTNNGKSWVTANEGFEEIEHFSTRTLREAPNGNLYIGTGTGDLSDGGAVYYSNLVELLDFVHEKNNGAKPQSTNINTTNETLFTSNHVMIDWGDDENSIYYEVEISLTPSLQESIISKRIINTNIAQISEGLKINTRYYYKIRGVNGFGKGEWSEVRSFIISENDKDEDGIPDEIDNCPETANSNQEDFDGDGIGDACDDDNDGVRNDVDICSNTPTGEEVNTIGCSESQLDDDLDGVMNDVDICSNTPTGEEVNTIGCSESQLDDDLDGVMNDVDTCPNTVTGSLVDANGCALLPVDNFTIEVISETCPNKNNGQILFAAKENRDYKLSINGNTQNFTSNTTLNNLTPGNYQVCIEVVGVTSPYCYEIKVKEGAIISGKSGLKDKQLQVVVSEGTLPYQVFVNGDLQFETYKNDFSFNVTHGDLVEVKTAVVCEGLYSKKIQLFNSLTIYPNPSDGLFTIAIPTNDKQVVVKVFNDISQMIVSKTYEVVNSRVQLDLTNKPKGVYLVKVYLDKEYVFKVVKK